MTRSVLSWVAACLSTALVAGDEQPGDAISLPGGVRFGAELHTRADVERGAGNTALDNYQLWNRLRLNASAAPANWIKLVVQAQDTRGADTLGASPRNTMDVRLGYIQFGRGESGWQTRVGRQELALGDERLVAADNEWDPLGLSFDAARVVYQGDRKSIEAFAGFLVDPDRRIPDRFCTKARVSGIAATWERAFGSIAPYLLWTRGKSTHDLMDRLGHRDVVTPGVLVRGELPKAFRYSVEIALQKGHVVGDPITAWAGHWEIGWKPLGQETLPKLRFEYDFASGDSDPADRRHNTFDDLYSGAYNDYGFVDPLGWRNIRYPGVGVELPMARRWMVSAGVRSYWLADVRDGLYTNGEEILIRNPEAGSSHLGNHFLAALTYTRAGRWRIGAGYSYLAPGAYLHRAGYGTAWSGFYLQSNLRL